MAQPLPHCISCGSCFVCRKKPSRLLQGDMGIGSITDANSFSRDTRTISNSKCPCIQNRRSSKLVRQIPTHSCSHGSLRGKFVSWYHDVSKQSTNKAEKLSPLLFVEKRPSYAAARESKDNILSSKHEIRSPRIDPRFASLPFDGIGPTGKSRSDPSSTRLSGTIINLHKYKWMERPEDNDFDSMTSSG